MAVLAVIVFHLRRDWLPGGFAGVDVFFVISGFLITRAILADLSAGTFSRGEFYRRRVKRISLPMLAVVLVVVVAAQLLLMPEDATRVAWSGIASVLSVVNVYFWLWLNRDYFARVAAEIPLLHLWSLGVEEQFYLVWPWVVPWLVEKTFAGSVPGALLADREGSSLSSDAPTRFRSGRRMALLAIVTVVSFGAGDLLSPGASSFAYYMLPTRAGELLIGAFLAFAIADGVLAAPGPALREVAGVAGGALVLGSFAWLSESQPFPGWRAIPPTLGAGLVLLSGQGAPSLVSRILSAGPLVAVGAVSYPAYLWHWPLIAFWVYGFRVVGNAAALGIFAATFVLAAASRRWIEIPARGTTESPGRVVLLQWLVPGAVVVAAAVLAIATSGYGPRILSKRYVDGLAAVDRLLGLSPLPDRVCQRGNPDPGLLAAERCEIGAAGAPEGVLLWGDSHAGHSVAMLEVIARAAGFRFRNFETPGCAPVLDAPGRFAVRARAENCERASRLVATELDRYPVVVLGVAWTAYETMGGLEAIFSTVRRLVASGHHVILLGQVPFFPRSYDPECPPKALSFPGLDCSLQTTAPIEPKVLRIDARVRDFAARTPGVSYFDANPELCPQGVCAIFGDDGAALYRDPSHLTLAGSKRLGEAVLRERGIPPPFDRVREWLEEARRRIRVGGDSPANAASGPGISGR